MTSCSRCGDETSATIMSKFNTDTICMACKKDERDAPNYKRADDAEVQAVRAMIASGGPGNFPGIGLAADDLAFLAARRAARRT